jgi:hypothetical protein
MFLDNQGNSLMAQGLIIIGGKSDFLDLNAGALGGPDTRSAERFQIRALERISLVRVPADRAAFDSLSVERASVQTR